VVGPLEASAVSGQADTSQSLSDRVEELIRQAKLDRKEALKLAAKERGISRRAAYDQLVDSKSKPN
jgi:16S rRNA C1402 (ribose-2'-O) methylase RsmI